MQIDPLLSRFGITLADTASTNSHTGGANRTSSATNTTGSTTNNQFTESSFMTLLTTELQAQDPTNPLDPNQFVAQLVQFNMLDQLTQIHTLLTASGSGQTQTGTSPASAAGANPQPSATGSAQPPSASAPATGAHQ